MNVFRREAASMSRVPEAIQLNVESEDAHAAALWHEAVRVRPLHGQVHAVCAPQAAQEATQQRATVLLLNVSVKVVVLPCTGRSNWILHRKWKYSLCLFERCHT